jgi:hypothetical protein
MVHQQNVFTISGFPSMDITSLDELEDQLDPQMFFAATDNTSSTLMAVPLSSP